MADIDKLSVDISKIDIKDDIKKCIVCKKNILSIDKNINTITGKFYKQCIECRDLKKIKYKVYYEENKQKIAEKDKEYYKKNKEKIKEYREKNKEKIAEKKKEYRENNKQKIAEYNKKKNKEYRDKEENKEKHKEYCIKYKTKNKDKLMLRQRDKRKNIKETNIPLYLVDKLRHNLKKNIYLSIMLKKSRISIDFLGCNIEQFIDFFKKKMDKYNLNNTVKMDFNNIHIDHIKPISAFNLNDDIEFILCCNYRNLQPLLASENFRKKNKWSYTDDEYWLNNIIYNDNFIDIFIPL